VGDRPGPMTGRRVHAERARQMTLIYAVMLCLMILIVIQFLLLMVAVDGFMGGRGDILLPAAGASGLCFLAACWLIRYIAAVGKQRA